MVIGIYENKWKYDEITKIISNNHLDDLTFVEIQDVKNVKGVDLLFVNIDMINDSKDLLGLIHNQDNMDIVFILETVKYLPVLLKEKRYDMITYPLVESLVMKYINKKYSTLKTSLTIKYGGGKENRTYIPYDSIYYIASNRRVVEVMGSDDDGLLGKMYCKLDDIEKQLPAYFIRCHKSYMINSNKIKKKNSKCIYLENVKNPISVSRAMKKNVL